MEETNSKLIKKHSENLIRLSKETFKLIQENTILETKEKLKKAIINLILTCEKEHKNKITKEIKRLKIWKEKRIKFKKNIIKSVQDIVPNTIINIESSFSCVIENKSGLSSGQITILSALMVIKSREDDEDEIYLDDVVETLDYKNKRILIEEIIHEKNVFVFTHDMPFVNYVKTFFNDEINVINLENKKIIVTWSELLFYYTITGKNNKLVRSVIKILSRYVAKSSIIHSQEGDMSEQEKNESSHWKHWKTSNWFFHFNPKIAKTDMNSFFPTLEVNNDMDSIEFIELIITKLEEVNEQSDLNISIAKLVLHLSNLLQSLKKEKQIYKHDLHGYKKEKNKGEFYNKKIKNKILRHKVHVIDITPIEIIKKIL